MSIYEEFIEIQLKIFQERLIEINCNYGIESEEADHFSKRLNELIEKHQSLINKI